MCYPAGSIASATTASSPMPTGPAISPWPAGCSAHPCRRRQARTATAPIVVAMTKSRTFVRAAAGAWSSSRPSNPAASRGCGLSHRSGSTAHDHHTSAVIPHHRFHPMPLSHRHRPRFTNGDRQHRLSPAKPRASITRSSRRSYPRRPKPAPCWSVNPRPVRNSQIRSSGGGKFSIDRHQRRCQLPRGFLPRRFSDACLRALAHACVWQASENP